MSACEIAYVVDDDLNVREAISELLASHDIENVTFATASAFLQFERDDAAGCLVLDLQLPDIDGLELQRRLLSSNSPPIVFISGDADVPASVAAMKAGAIEFLTKPIDTANLLAAIRLGFSKDRRRRHNAAGLTVLQQRLSSLTPREREVLPLVADGMLNKQAASLLGISEVTLQVHRGQIMRKMEAESFADLVRMAAKLRIDR